MMMMELKGGYGMVCVGSKLGYKRCIYNNTKKKITNSAPKKAIKIFRTNSAQFDRNSQWRLTQNHLLFSLVVRLFEFDFDS